MKELTKKDKSIMADIIKRFVVDKEIFFAQGGNCYRFVDSDLLNSNFEYGLYNKLRIIFYEYINPDHLDNSIFTLYPEKVLRQYPIFCEIVKKHKMIMKMKMVEKDF